MTPMETFKSLLGLPRIANSTPSSAGDILRILKVLPEILEIPLEIHRTPMNSQEFTSNCQIWHSIPITNYTLLVSLKKHLMFTQNPKIPLSILKNPVLRGPIEKHRIP